MNARITWLVIYHVIGLGLAWWFAWRRDDNVSALWTLALMAGTTLLWLLLDHWQAARSLRWLRTGELRETPRHLIHLWAEITDAASRAVHRQWRATREAEEKLAAFLQAMQASPLGVVLLDGMGRMEWFNHIAAAHFGLRAPQDIAQHIINLVRDPAFVQYWVQPQSQPGITLSVQEEACAHPLRLGVQLFSFGQGRRLLLSRDITALEQAERMRRDFVANVSHEIRTPLTVLGGFVETLQNLPLDAAQTAHYLDLMAQQAQRMQVLVQDLLMLSRIEGSPPPEQTPVDAQALLEQCVREAQALSSALDLRHHISCQDDTQRASSLLGAQAELHSALGNLLGNAVRYTPAGGHITATMRLCDDGALEISVRDDGPGIAPEHLPRITERFYRVDRSRSRETGGTGLGLAIVKHVIQRHGGQLRIQSALEQGSTFTLHLPAWRVRAGLA